MLCGAALVTLINFSLTFDLKIFFKTSKNEKTPFLDCNLAPALSNNVLQLQSCQEDELESVSYEELGSFLSGT